jgi:hypothetical protein
MLMRDSKRISRRAALKAGATLLTVGLSTTAATTVALAQDADGPLPTDAGKMAKNIVAYRYHHGPHDRHCAICANFLPLETTHLSYNTCKVVAGKIDPNGYCSAFAKKKTA